MGEFQNIGWRDNTDGHGEAYRQAMTELADADLLHSQPPGCEHLWKCLGPDIRGNFVSQCQVCGEVNEQ